MTFTWKNFLILIMFIIKTKVNNTKIIVNYVQTIYVVNIQNLALKDLNISLHYI